MTRVFSAARPALPLPPDYVAQHVERMRRTRLGTRQAQILAWMRQRALARGLPPGVQTIANGIGYPHNTTDIRNSLAGLAVRGLVRRDGAAWYVTPAGWGRG